MILILFVVLFVWIFDECKCSNIFPIQQVLISFSSIQHVTTFHGHNSIDGRSPQKGGREETDLGAKHRVSHCIGVVREPRNLTLIKGIIFTIYIYIVYIYIVYIYILYIYILYIYILCIYIYVCVRIYIYIICI